MKSDSTPESSPTSTKSTNEWPQSNHPEPSQPLPQPPPPPRKASFRPFKKSLPLAPLANALALDSTESSESTAKRKSATTPPRQSGHSAETPPLPARYPAVSAEVIPANANFFNEPDSTTPTSKELAAKPKLPRPSAVESNEAFLKRMNYNINLIQEDQSTNISWIRKLANQKWISIVDIFLAGFTLLFFTSAFYFVCHINPTLEMKLTPEFRARVHRMIKNNFESCNHSSWIRTDNSLAPNINDIRCFEKYEYGRIFFETFTASSSNSSNVCNIDRVEVHQCYKKNETSDSMNIFWGVNDASFEQFTCNGTNLNSVGRNFWSLSSPVQKYPMIDTVLDEKFFNRTISSTAFFFTCPTCALISRTVPADPNSTKNWYMVDSTHLSIPEDESQKCLSKWVIPCELNQNHLVKNAPKSFSQQVASFEFVVDCEEFCIKGFCNE